MMFTAKHPSFVSSVLLNFLLLLVVTLHNFEIIQSLIIPCNNNYQTIRQGGQQLEITASNSNCNRFGLSSSHPLILSSSTIRSKKETSLFVSAPLSWFSSFIGNREGKQNGENNETMNENKEGDKNYNNNSNRSKVNQDSNSGSGSMNGSILKESDNDDNPLAKLQLSGVSGVMGSMENFKKAQQIGKVTSGILQELSSMTVEGSAADGKVKVFYDGQQRPVGVQIDEAYYNDIGTDVADISSALTKAMQEAYTKSSERMDEKLKIFYDQLGLPNKNT